MLWTAAIITLILIILAAFFFIRPGSSHFNKSSSKITPDTWAQTAHRWEITSKTGIYYCNVCTKLIGKWFGTKLSECTVCGAIAHMFCSPRHLECKRKTLSGTLKKFNSHQWIDGNLPVNSICDVCKITCGSIYALDGSTCLWCQKVCHDECKYRKLNENCDFGRLKKIIILPSEVKVSKPVKPKEATEIKIELIDEDKVPIVAIVNKLSGGQAGLDVLKSFYRYLNPIQVIDLLDEGLDKLKIFRQLKKVKIIVGGGDGTIGSVLSYLNDPSFKEEGKFKMPVAMLPLGTGNDLSKSLGWGQTSTSSDVWSIIRSVNHASNEILLDQCTVQIQDSKKSIMNQKMYNYLGIGLDAKVALGFHKLRKRYPYLFKSRVGNKFLYTHVGTQHLLSGKKLNLMKNIQIICDGKEIQVPDVECIIFLNIRYWGGGVDLWNNSYSEEVISESFLSDTTVSSEIPERRGEVQSKFKQQSICDNLMEVVGFSSMLHMGQVQTGLAHGIRICQGGQPSIFELMIRKFEIKINAKMSMPTQIDGEPFEISGPATINIDIANKVSVYIKTETGKTPAEVKVLKVLDWAEESNKITHDQRMVLQDQFLKTLNEQ